MKTIRLAPDPDSLVRFLQHLYREQPSNAVHILQSGWPTIRTGDAHQVLKKALTLPEALERGL